MGNLNLNNSQPSTLSSFQTRFIISQHALDPSFTTMFNLHEKLTNHKYILTILTTNDKSNRELLEYKLCKKLANRKQIDKYIMPIDHYLFDHQQTYCNQIFKCYLLFDAGSTQPLRYWITNAQYYKSIQHIFNNQVVYHGVINLIKAVAVLNFQKDPHEKINLDTVYFNKNNNQFILADPYISPITQYHEQYHSPEKLKLMKNQIESHNPFLSDLFSIGAIALKVLGYPVSQCYTVNKNINMQKIRMFASNITHANLKALIISLVSTDPMVRQNTFNQVKAYKTQSDTIKTRTLSGKVSSVRKSFNHDEQPTIKYTKNLGNMGDRPRQNERGQNQIPINTYTNGNAQYGADQSGLLFKRKEHAYQIYQPQPQVFTPVVYHQNSITHPFVNIQSKPFTSHHKFQAHDELDRPQEVPSFKPQPLSLTSSINQPIYPQSISMYHPKPLPTKSSMTLFSTSGTAQTAPFYPMQSKSQQIFNNSNSDKFLKNVSSTPNSNELKIQGLGASLSQNGINRSQIKKSEIYVVHESQSAQIFTKPQELMSLTKINKTNLFSPRSVPTHAHTPSQQMNQKQISIYRSSESFQSDHLFQNKIMENLKHLENKISEAINSSRLNITQSQISMLSYGLSNSKNQIIESIIVPRQGESLGVTNGTVYGLVEQIQSGGVKVVEQVELKEQNKSEPSQKIKQNIENEKQNENKQKISPILVRQSDLSVQKNDSDPQKYYQESLTQNNQEEIDYLNINPTKFKQPNSQSEQESYSEQSIHQTPRQKSSSSARLQVINQTIPEQSDEQSLEERQIKNKGDYVEEAYENGGKYIGYMLNGQRNGHGTFYYRDGGYYEGRWKNNMMCGFGKLFYETQKLAYEGEWYQDQFHGRGTVHNDQPQAVPAEGFDYRNMNESQNYWQYYQGDLSHDTKAGLGKLVLSNQEYYEGQFKNDLVHGKGSFHKIDGKIIKGVWAQGILVKQG